MPPSPDFIGSFERTVDDQGRIKIPVEVRDYLLPDDCETFVITRWLEGCLAAFHDDQWHEFSLRLRKHNDRNLTRLVTANAVKTRIDGEGRISIPRKLLGSADINGKVLLVGMLDKVELWSPSKFEETVEAELDFDKVIGDLSSIADGVL